MNPLLRKLRRLRGDPEQSFLLLRPRAPEQPLPAMGSGAFFPLFPKEGCGLSQPALGAFGGERAVFCVLSRPGQPDAVAAAPVRDGRLGTPVPVAEWVTPLSCPQLLPKAGGAPLLAVLAGGQKLVLYRCKAFPFGWEQAEELPLGGTLRELYAAPATPGGPLVLTGSEPVGPELACFLPRRFLLRQEASGYVLTRDEAFCAAHDTPTPAPAQAGAGFLLDGQPIRCVRAGDTLQFYIVRADGEVPLCAAEPHRLTVQGVPAQTLLAATGYDRDDAFEVAAVTAFAPKAQPGGKEGAPC